MGDRGGDMDILICTNSFPPACGGMHSFTFDVARVLAAKWNVRVLATASSDPSMDPPYDKEIRDKHGIVVQRISNRYLAREWQFLVEGLRLNKERRFDICISNIWITTGLAVQLLAMFIQCKHAVLVYAYELNPAKKGLRGIMRSLLFPAARLMFRRCDLILAISHWTAKRTADFTGSGEKIVVTQIGVDTDVFTRKTPTAEEYARSGLDGRGRYLLTLTHLIGYKGQDVVIRAMPKILQEVPDAIYIIAGKGPYEAHLRELAESLGVSDRVVFTGFVKEGQKALVYNLAHLYVMISRPVPETGDVEGYGITYAEALACGIPCVAASEGGVVDVVRDGVTGVLVRDFNSEEEVAAVVIRLLKNPGEARQLGENGAALMRSELSWDTIGHRIIDSIQVAVGQRQA